MSNPEVTTATTPVKKNKGGRPKGSKNKPKSVVVPGATPATLPAAMVQFLPDYLRPVPEQIAAPEPVKIPELPPIIKDGFPNLPEAKIIGRPFGSKNSTPRKRRAQKQVAAPATPVLQPPVVGLQPPLVEENTPANTNGSAA